MNIITFSNLYADDVADLILPIQQAEFGISITREDQPDLSDIPGFYQRGAGQFWLALIDGQVVGTIALLDIGGRCGALRKMFVSQQFRGSKHRVSASLLDVLFAHASKECLSVVYLGTTDKFLAAHRFYEKNEFVVIPEAELPDSFPRMKVDTRFYKRAVHST